MSWLDRWSPWRLRARIDAWDQRFHDLHHVSERAYYNLDTFPELKCRYIEWHLESAERDLPQMRRDLSSAEEDRHERDALRAEVERLTGELAAAKSPSNVWEQDVKMLHESRNRWRAALQDLQRRTVDAIHEAAGIDNAESYSAARPQHAPGQGDEESAS